MFTMSNSLAQEPQDSGVIEAFSNVQSMSNSFDEINPASDMSNTDNQALNNIETETVSIFPYVFHVLLIIGLFAVLSFDTSITAKSKRKPPSLLNHN
jgi:hypothetical protein